MFKSLFTIALTLSLAAGFTFAEGMDRDNVKPAVKKAVATQSADTQSAAACESRVGSLKKVTTQPAATAQQSGVTSLQQASYGIGFSIGRQIGQMGDAVDLSILIRGLTDSVQGNKPMFTQAQLKAAFAALDAHMAKKTNKVGAENIKVGQAFLKANAAKEGVKTTDSGLQYKIIKEGTGKSPKATDTVRVHYRGTFIDGKTFDSSYDRGEPVEFPLGGVIPGWTEGLQLIKEGGKAMLWIPGNLAYGPKGRGEIPPSSTLIFEIELLEVK